jgi:hypothetical protein
MYRKLTVRQRVHSQNPVAFGFRRVQMAHNRIQQPQSRRVSRATAANPDLIMDLI